MTETPFFQFEADFVESLRCIPMQVRLKLDTCGIKLKLTQWHLLAATERQELVALPCQLGVEVQHYRTRLEQMILAHTGTAATPLAIDPAPAWKNPTAIDASVLQQSQAVGIGLTLEQWARLSEVQRFALCKLSRSNHENRNFVPALQEFQVI